VILITSAIDGNWLEPSTNNTKKRPQNDLIPVCESDFGEVAANGV